MRVQQAYGERNLEALDVLTALTEALAGEVSRSTGLDQLRRAAQEFERLVAPLQRRLERARGNRAWRFSELKGASARVGLLRVIEKELLIDVGKLRARLRQIESQIARFSRTRMEDPVEWTTRP
jgi:uncharacterized protein YhaN